MFTIIPFNFKLAKSLCEFSVNDEVYWQSSDIITGLHGVVVAVTKDGLDIKWDDNRVNKYPRRNLTFIFNKI